ncbi:MAG TPA: ornithine carbamoyltransferase [Clostridiales bacterium]|jgi:ornithine carbamoyltransferase|nr:ornithine carbamoyltransferase [Clostridiales bacterium]
MQFSQYQDNEGSLDLYNYQAKSPFSQKHLLSLQDYSSDEICQVLSLGLKLKNQQRNRIPHKLLEGKILAMIFAKSSTRTRVSFEVGMTQLGGTPLFLSSSDIQLGRGETIADTARVLSRYVDGIMIRTYKQSDVEELAKHGSVPVINALTDLLHPCQALADMMTIYEAKGDWKGKKLAFLGDGNNMAHSLMIACSKLGMDFSIGCPEGYEPDEEITAMAKQNALSRGSSLEITHNPEKAAEKADVVYTDVWSSMGQESESEERKKAFAPYQVNSSLFALAKSDAIFLHCLPAQRGEEVTADIIDGPHSLVFDQAENRLHVQKAVLALLMK